MKNLKATQYVPYILALFIVFSFSTQLSSFAKHIDETEKYKAWSLLTQMAEEVFFLVQKQEFEASRKQLQHLSTHFLSLETGQYVDKIEQVRVITETIVQAEEALNAVNLDPEQVQRKILKMKLTLDAVAHKKQPLWLNYYPTIVDKMDMLYFALKKDERDSFYHYVNRLATDYEFIRPSLVISHEIYTVEKMDSQMKYLIDKRSNIWNDPQHAEVFLDSLSQEWKKIFYKADEESSLSFIYLMVGMGTIIITVLSYVAWRKYKGEKEIKKVVWKK